MDTSQNEQHLNAWQGEVFDVTFNTKVKPYVNLQKVTPNSQYKYRVLHRIVLQKQ